MKVLRSLYAWVLHWAETPYGIPALFLLAFAEASFFPIPPDVLLLALCLAIPRKSFRFAAVATMGSVLGGVAGYGIGFGVWELVSGWFFSYIPGFSAATFQQVQNLFASYDFWVVFTAGFTPIPYKVITIGAGVFNINFPIFMLASVLSRGLRFFLVSWLIFRYGGAMRDFIERYFNWLSIAFMILLVGGFVLLKHLL